jgi:hypothetical protein
MCDAVWDGSENSPRSTHPLVSDDNHLRPDLCRGGDECVRGVADPHLTGDFQPDALEAVCGPSDDALGVRPDFCVGGYRIDSNPAGYGEGSAAGNCPIAHDHVQRRAEGGSKFTGFVDGSVRGD